ncbi:MAG: tRNA pseudouridine(38-40) synthase TruA, partial [Candidatus Omnitrophica bacterium]|nr:tRNA pseudouridine(38-40) synthase TruA [Candidatus Omnitrophota bacterium]
TNYCGWQVQRSRKKSIQGVLQETLSRILQEEIRVKGAGRTDAGVHARAQVAHFETSSRRSLPTIQRAANALLPRSIVISRVREVPPFFHSRFQARWKTYRYTICNRRYRPVFDRQQVYYYPGKLDCEAMQQAARCLIGRHDFKAFQSAGGRQETVRTVKKIKIVKRSDFFYIDIEADGFLYNMVRAVVGTLIEAGRGRFSLPYVKNILLSGERKLAGPTVPAQGLCLMQVKYR